MVSGSLHLGNTMKQAIQEKLTHIAHTEPLHFLMAVASGSRAWGFASPDVDERLANGLHRPNHRFGGYQGGTG